MRRGRDLVVFALRYELALYRSLWRWVTRRPVVPPGGEAHPYVGAIAALLWAFVGVSFVELIALHLILPWEGVRLAADILGIWGLVWMLGLTASLHVYPHVVTDRVIIVRGGHAFALELPWSQVVAVSVRERSRESSRSIQVDEEPEGDTVNVVVASRTNVELRLRSPADVVVRGVVRRVTTVRLFADDPRALAAACRRHVDEAAARVRRSTTD